MSHAELNRRIREGLQRAEQNEFVWSRRPIEVRWKEKYNWIPPSELPEYQAKWQRYKELAAKD